MTSGERASIQPRDEQAPEAALRVHQRPRANRYERSAPLTDALATLPDMTDPPTTSVGFRVEADMLAPLASGAGHFLPAAQVLFEIPCTAGVPDLVLLNLDRDAIARRCATAPLTEPLDVRVMLALQTSPALPMSTQDLSASVRVSTDHLRRTVLPRLVAGGHVERADEGWRGVYAFRSLARSVVTVEAKIRNWRGGLAQATRHTAVADQAWLVLDRHRSRAAIAHSDWFRTYGVGLATLSNDGALSTLVHPNVNRSRQPHRELLVERAVRLHLAGAVSGPLPRVFGSVPLASTGDDPRLAGASAR